MKFLVALIALPTVSFAMGNFFRPAYLANPYPTGVREDCSHIYESGGYNRGLLGRTYDKTCMYIAKSTPIEVGQDCRYDDYIQTDQYKDSQVRTQTANGYKVINEEAFTMLEYGSPNVQKFQNYFSQIFQRPTGQLEYELLVGKYCQRAVPQSAREAFSMNVDVPADIISFWTEDYVRSRWNQQLDRLTLQYPDTDFPSLIDLNLQGVHIWEKMLSCSQGDAEKARYQYFTSQFACEEGAALKEEIKNYVQSVKVYFSTSFIKPLKIDYKYKFEVIDAVLSKSGKKIEANYDSFPTFHPLFIQAIHQLLVDVYPVGSNDRVKMEFTAKKLGITKDRKESTLLQAISQLDHFMPGGLPPQGLWPSANFSVFGQVQQVRIKFMQEIVDDLKVQEFHGVAFGAFRKLPDFYASNKTRLADEIRAMNQRYGL